MKRQLKKILAVALMLGMVLSLWHGSTVAYADEGIVQGDYTGKTVILHTNDVHGSIQNYAKIVTLRDAYEERGAEVILADAGDYSQGSSYVSTSKGQSAIIMMDIVGYDYATLGNHEFDYGTEALLDNLNYAEFKVLCADVFDEDGDLILDAGDVYTTKGGTKIGFFGMETPETKTTANPSLFEGVQFASENNFYSLAQVEVNTLKSEGADIVICVGHLGVDSDSGMYQSSELYKNVAGIDFMIDGHSHTVMTSGDDGEPIQSTGDHMANIGVIVIDDATKTIESNELISTDDIPMDEEVLGAANYIIAEVDEKYGEEFAQTLVTLNGERNPGNRTMETNLGDLICDAMIWEILKDDGAIYVDKSNIVAIENGGGIRATVDIGGITGNNVINVLPFGNTISIVYVNGATLLEALEASTFQTPDEAVAFPQVAGIDFTIDTTKEYDANTETYPDSTYYGPQTVNRVTINSVNGKPFDLDGVYGVITNDFIASGGDTYYVFGSSPVNTDTGILLYDAVVDYINNALGGVVSEQYANPQGRVHLK
jgi:2',3'-cyclic-nucleotide 2'-phosphodiesterase (5'-nucleotidase family)